MMFAHPGPRLYALPPGADFPARLAEGLIERLGAGPPERLARVTVFVNTQRMRRRLRDWFQARGPGFLPRLRVVTDLAEDPVLVGAGRRVSALGRRLELAVLIDRLLSREPDLAPRSALYDLADSLAALMDEVRAEGVSPAALHRLDMAGHAAHWARTRRFLDLVEHWFGPGAAPDAEARQRAAVEALVAGWAAHPPADPVIVAGSTGSRGTTAALMRAVAGLPQGALVLPGFDTDLPAEVWDGMAEAETHEDHPQFRYRRLLDSLGLSRCHMGDWDTKPAPDGGRNALVSLALRPAPVTDQWIADGPGLGDLTAATARMTLVEAPTPRAEAVAVALCLRQAVAAGKRAALITPDRDLTRRVTAALDRWGLRPDDSAGLPLMHSAPGRLLRLTARAMGRVLAVDECLSLLKHPLAFSGAERGPHLRLTRELELALRRNGPAFPDAGHLRAWAGARPEEGAAEWSARLGLVLEGLSGVTAAPLPDLVAQHMGLTEALARGTAPEGSGGLWDKAAGAEAQAAMVELLAEAPAGLRLTVADYVSLLDGILSRRQVREAVGADERIQILGPQEARVQGADLVVLAGLNEGVWPAAPTADPWLNRRMRLEAGLLLPERRIGLSAHDFQMAAAAPEVVLTRAHRDAEAETVPSRWLNRLTNLLDGLPDTGGRAALAAMRARGQALMDLAARAEAPAPGLPARRPSPRPPVERRPARLSLTEIETLIRDPYAIYARHVLRLRPLSPLRPVADARLRGEVLHRVPEAFLRAPLPDRVDEAAARLMQIADEVLARDVAWPGMRAVWRARMAQLARPFAEAVLADSARPVALERKYAVELPDLGFTLVGKPDRLDLTGEGRLRIVDYKTGSLPTKKQQAHFARQLHLAAVMAALGAFPEVGAHDACDIVYVELKPGLKDLTQGLAAAEVAQAHEELRALVLAWRQAGRGYTSRRAMEEVRRAGDYDDLARFGEWGVTEDPAPEDVE